MRYLPAALAAASLWCSLPARACERAAPWSRLGLSTEAIATPVPLVLVGAAIAAPMIMAPSGADHELRVFSQRQLGGEPNAEIVSLLTPYVLSVALIGVDTVAHLTDSCDIARPASAMLQAMAITALTAEGLKWITGRTWPNAGRDPNLPDRLEHPEFARQFNWFSWKDGSAWPSGHTATMVAAATALTTVTYGRSWLSYVAFAGATGVAAGMWLGDHHWASDIVSGALMGVAIGRSVGLAFREDTSTHPSNTLTILPWRTRDVQGVSVAAAW